MKIRVLDGTAAEALAAADKICMPSPWTAAMFENELTNELTVYIGAYDGEKLIGYCGMWTVADEGQITKLAVLPQYRRKGIACMLMQALADAGKSKSISRLLLEVRESNAAAIGLYRALGFSCDGIRGSYYSHPTENALLMSVNITKPEKR